MKILHTADWHAGRSLHGTDRTPEIRDALDEIAELAKQEAVDLIAVAGDLFDTKNPSADAEAAVYGFFRDTGAAGIPSVVIAGNHDSGARLDAVASLLQLASVHVVGLPRVAGDGGTFDLELGGERVRVAALPFVSERRLVRATQVLHEDLGEQRASYRSSMRQLIANLTAGFGPDAINLLMMHTTLEGATLANSEYAFHASETYTIDADPIPMSTSYVALGHIHKPQPIQGLAEHMGRYSGSPLQLDFGEQGDAKYVYVVDARAGRATELVREHRIEAGKRLKQVRLDPEALERRSAELADWRGWLKIRLLLDRPRPGLKERIRADLPNVLSVETVLPEIDDGDTATVDAAAIDVLDAYRRYVAETRGEAPPELTQAFRDLWDAELEGGA